MVKARCISKIRDKNNVILGYVLVDSKGKQMKVNAKKVKKQY